jgi:hypothetical protein
MKIVHIQNEQLNETKDQATLSSVEQVRPILKTVYNGVVEAVCITMIPFIGFIA